MRRLVVCFLVFLLGGMFSCRQAEEKKSLVSLKEMAAEHAPIFLSSLMDYQLYPLSEKALIGDIQKIIADKDCFYILCDGKTIDIFDRSGRPVEKIDRLGKGGKEEYLSIKDFDVYKDKLFLMDVRRILFLDKQGNYQYDRPFDFKMQKFEVLDENEIMLFTFQPDYMFYVTDYEGNVKNKYLPASPALNVLSALPFHRWGEKIVIQKYGTNEFSEYDRKQQKYNELPLFNSPVGMTFEKYEQFVKEYGWSSVDNYTQEYIVPFSLATNAEQFQVFWMYQGERNFTFGNINGKNIQSCRLKRLIDDVSFTNAYFLYNVTCAKSEDSFITYAWPADIARNLKSFAEKYPERTKEEGYRRMQEVIDHISDTELANPILIEYKFKE